MTRVLVFGGTSEGREITNKLCLKGVDVTLSLFSEYALNSYDNFNNLTIVTGDKSKEEIKNMVKGYDYIVDATHPYAKIITQNIKDACSDNGNLIRVIRKSLEVSGDIYVNSIEEAVDYLNKKHGNILLTTGSNNLHMFNSINRERLYVRILPSITSIEKAINCSIKPSRIIAMEGPFTKGMNIEHIKYSNAKFLVTKESGVSGGYIEKLNAAKDEGIISIVIGRGEVESGHTVDSAIDIISAKEDSNRYFPMFVSLKNRLIKVIGGGNIAYRRLNTLIKFTNNIQVIAPYISNEVMTLCRENNIQVFKRGFIDSDILGADIVLGLTNNSEVNGRIHTLCQENNILCNISDNRDKCDFYFPGVYVNGPVVIGVTASGEDHKLAKLYTNKIKNLMR